MSGELQGFAPEQVVRWKTLGNSKESNPDYADSDFYEVQVMEGPTLPGTTLEDLDGSVTLKNLTDGGIHKVRKEDLLNQNSNSLGPSAPTAALAKPSDNNETRSLFLSELAVIGPKKPQEKLKLKPGDTVTLGGSRRQDRMVCTVVSVESTGDLRVRNPHGEVISVRASEVRSSSNPPLDLSVAK
jgi:hypothetical protein